MSEPTASDPPNGAGPPVDDGVMLQFDQAEFATPQAERPACAICKLPIAEEYFEIGGEVLCPMCRHGVVASFRGGSPAARFFTALAFGLTAAAIGAVIDYVFVRMTHANWALISILVGFVVGAAVRKGSGNRGGRAYQLLAVFLTYSSIVAMNVPLILEHTLNQAERDQAARMAIQKTPRHGRGAGTPAPVAEAKEAVPPKGVAGKAGVAADEPNAPRLPSSAVGWIVFLLVVAGIFSAVPVLEAVHSPISGFIYGFALWEAWKINKPIRLVFNGPFRLGAPGGAEVGPEGAGHGS